MRRIIRSFDAFVRRGLGVFEFTQDPACILRLQRVTLHNPLPLHGTDVMPGSPVLLLHLWNERIPPFSAEGPSMAWAHRMSHSLGYSLRLVGTYMANEFPRAGLNAVGAITVLGLASGTADILAYLGFEPHPYSGRLGRFGEWWENAYTWSLMWAYNPDSLRGKRLSQLRRTEYWMLASAFLERFTTARD